MDVTIGKSGDLSAVSYLAGARGEGLVDWGAGVGYG